MQRRATSARPLWAASVLIVGALIAHGTAKAQDSSGVRAIPTYESVGLYWSNPGASAAAGCEVRFRRSGDSAWTQGLAIVVRRAQ